MQYLCSTILTLIPTCQAGKRKTYGLSCKLNGVLVPVCLIAHLGGMTYLCHLKKLMCVLFGILVSNLKT